MSSDGAPSAFAGLRALADPGDLLLRPGSLRIAGGALLVDEDGAVAIAGRLSADVILAPDGSGAAADSAGRRTWLAMYDRQDTGVSDSNFVRDGALPPSALRDVMPPSRGGTGLSSAPSASWVGAPIVFDGAGAAPAPGLVVRPSGLAVDGEIRLFRDEAALSDPSAAFHTLSNRDGVPSVAFSESAWAPLVPSAAELFPPRPSADTIAYQRLSYSDARLAWSVAPGPAAAPLSNAFVATYASQSQADAYRPRGALEVASGLSPLPYGAPPEARPRDPGLLVRAVVPVDPLQASLPASGNVDIADVPAFAHRAVRVTVEDARGTLAVPASIAWSTLPPVAVPDPLRATSYAGLTVDFGATLQVHAPAGTPLPVAVRPGLIATDVDGQTVPSFTQSVGALQVPGGLSESNANDATVGPALAWALWETFLASDGSRAALDAVAPETWLHPSSPAALAFAVDKHLAFDSGEWSAVSNRYSAAYRPFLLLGDAFSNLRLRLFPGIFIPNQDVQTFLVEYSADGSAVAFRYTIVDSLAGVAARVFPLTDALASWNSEPAGNVPGSGNALDASAGTHVFSFSNLAHSTHHRLILETLDLVGTYRPAGYDFRTPDVADPELRILSGAFDAGAGTLSLAWVASDSNDGGIDDVVAFSGSNPPVPGAVAVLARIDSDEPRTRFPGFAPAKRSDRGVPGGSQAYARTFVDMADARHLPHYVQVVARDRAGYFGADQILAPPDVVFPVRPPRIAFADYGAEVPELLCNVPVVRPAGPRFSNALAVGAIAFQADTSNASCTQLALSAEAAAMILAPGGAFAASNLLALLATAGAAASLPSNSVGTRAP
jgi:hypothetical protein